MYWDPTDKTAVETTLIKRYEDELKYDIKWAGSIAELAKTFRKPVGHHDNALFVASYTYTCMLNICLIFYDFFGLSVCHLDKHDDEQLPFGVQRDVQSDVFKL